MDRRTLLKAGLVAGGIALGMVACSRPTYALRYRLRLTMRVDGRASEGSSVMDLRLYHNKYIRLGEAMPVFERALWGQAVVVDVGKHSPVFGVLRAPNNTPFVRGPDAFNAKRADDVFFNLLPKPRKRQEAETLTRIQEMEGTFDIRPHKLPPVLVRFGDVNDPTSAVLVNPEGVSLRATISICDDATTDDIEQVLPWLSEIEGSFLRPVSGWPETRVSRGLNRAHFKSDG